MDGGNAVDATCAMLAAAATMWDTLHWGGETQALIHNPQTGKVIGINAMGVAPTGATAEFFNNMGLAYPPEYGPLAATTPGTPGGLMVMLAEYGTLRLADVLAPAIEMAGGYPIEAGTVQRINDNLHELIKWPYSKALFLSSDGGRLRATPAGRLVLNALVAELAGTALAPALDVRVSAPAELRLDDAAKVAGLVKEGMCIKDFDMVVKEGKPARDVWITPGTGRVDFPKVLKTLRKGGFTSGHLVIECVARGDGDLCLD